MEYLDLNRELEKKLLDALLPAGSNAYREISRFLEGNGPEGVEVFLNLYFRGIFEGYEEAEAIAALAIAHATVFPELVPGWAKKK